jgi:hypothetical protein
LYASGIKGSNGRVKEQKLRTNQVDKRKKNSAGERVIYLEHHHPDAGEEHEGLGEDAD